MGRIHVFLKPDIYTTLKRKPCRFLNVCDEVLSSRMNSIGPECNELKSKYDSCFNVWFSERFLKGDTSDSMCKPLFVLYQECVRKAIKDQHINLEEIDKQVLGTDQEKKPPQEEGS